MQKCGLVLGLVLAMGLAGIAWAGELRQNAMAIVNKDGAQIKQGSNVVATLDKGARIKVYFIFGDPPTFARVMFMMGGKRCWGDMSVKDLDPASGTGEKTPSKSPFVADDKVVVIAKEATIKNGDDILGTVPEGTQLTVKKVKDDWLQVTAEIKGKATDGWIHARDVDYPTMKDKEKSPPPKKEETKEKGKE